MRFYVAHFCQKERKEIKTSEKKRLEFRKGNYDIVRMIGSEQGILKHRKYSQ
jgi:hypothetical protein